MPKLVSIILNGRRKLERCLYGRIFVSKFIEAFPTSISNSECIYRRRICLMTKVKSENILGEAIIKPPVEANVRID